MNGTLKAQLTHAAWDAERGYDIEEEARGNPFLAAHIAECDSKYGKDEQEVDE